MNLRILIRCLIVLAVTGAFAVQSLDMQAKTKESKSGQQAEPDQEVEKGDEKGGSEILRQPAGPFENLRNRVSNLDFYSSNYGILFLNVQAGVAGGIYPRNSGNAYLFGGGIWFGAQKLVPKDPEDPNSERELKKMSVVSYNPNSGASWMVPGEVTQPFTNSRLDQSLDGINKYRMYFSTDYNSFSGEPFDKADITNGGPNWPIWDSDPDETFFVDRYLGRYISDVDKRNRETYAKGPAIVSGEDIVTMFKDTDLSRYEIGRGRAQREGYPIGIEVDQRIYSWGFGQFQNFIFIRYSIVNKSSDTLFSCWMAPALDTDIGAAANDRTKAAILDADTDSLNLGVQWSEQEGSTRFGYMGADFLESPATDFDGFIRKDQKFYSQDEQLGMKTLVNWIIDIDPRTPEERYDFMARGQLDDDNGPGDKRFLMATGPFNMVPGDTARVVLAILIAPSVAASPTGEWEDLDSLLKIDAFAQKVYDENFIAPRPPDQANVNWRPLDNGVELNWDEASERSLDDVEDGLDFLGYLIQRGRKPAGNVIQYDSIVGYNLGFKTIGRFDLPPLPNELIRIVAARQGDLSILGPWWRLPMLADTMSGVGAFLTQQVPCVDTLKREGLPDTVIISTNRQCIDSIFNVTFDPFDDESNDSTVFDGTQWTTDARWGDRFKNKAIRDVVRDAINEIMDSITNGRTFIDVGDDNGDGQVTANDVDLTTNEKLINNIDYYYRVLAFDEGDVTTGTPIKVNSAIEGKNEVRATPEAPPAGLKITPEIISEEGLGGIHNFRVLVFDQERMGQLFGGDTIDFEFQPYRLWNSTTNSGFRPVWYTTEIVARSRKLGELNRFVVPYNTDFADRANNIFRNLDSTFISRFVYFRRDTVVMSDGAPFDSTKVDSVYYDARNITAPFGNTFVTRPAVLPFGTNGITKSTFGVAFDYSGRQYGDSLRFGIFEPDSALLPERGTSIQPFETVSGSADVSLVDFAQFYGQTSTTAGPISIPSIGQVRLEVEFQEGGNESLEWTKFQGGTVYRADNVPYLTTKVRNIASFAREVINEDGTITTEDIQYDFEFEPDEEYASALATSEAGTVNNLGALARLVEHGKHAILAYGWTNTGEFSPDDRKKPLTRASPEVVPGIDPIGTPNRYYNGTLMTTEGEHLVFTHRLLANGSVTLLDFAGMGNTAATVVGPVPENRPTQDFQVGDKFIINFTGGALGLPEPGAKISVAIPDPIPADGQFTDDLLDAIRVVPNPYLVNHLGQRTAAEKLLYFTRLPEACTIEIYTAAGELLQTVEHDVSTNVDGRVAVNAWNLVTKGNRQAQSQLLIARITTPDGAETIKKFSIVVGGFRLFGN